MTRTPASSTIDRRYEIGDHEGAIVAAVIVHHDEVLEARGADDTRQDADIAADLYEQKAEGVLAAAGYSSDRIAEDGLHLVRTVECAPARLTPADTARLFAAREVDVVTVELAAHGEFKTAIEVVARFEKTSKAHLAKLIAEAYGGGCGKASTASYWRTFPKAVLVVVFGGLTDPRN